jgi:hypothetical protein
MAAKEAAQAKSGSASSSASSTSPSAAPATSPAQNDLGEVIRLGKRYCIWKPGGRPITGFLLGISGIRMTEGDVKETVIIRTTMTTDAYDWDATKKEATKRDSKPNEDLAVFLTAGLETLRAYAIDPHAVRKVFIPAGKKIKISGGKTFWQYISDDPEAHATDTLNVSVKKWKRNASTIVQQVVARPKADDDASSRAPAPIVDDDAPTEDFDEIPF